MNSVKRFVLADTHIHTSFAYCSDDTMVTSKIIEQAKALGLEKMAFTEHAAQLYVEANDYWSANFVENPEIVLNNKNTELNRMDTYIEQMRKYRSDFVNVGLEVEVDRNGDIVLLEEHKEGWDILIGAVHYIPQRFFNDPVKGFIWTTEKVIESGVDVLAHPFRYFIRNKLEVPKQYFKPLAKLLAETKTDVELNFHTNTPELDFFECCLSEGVNISFGSDSHTLAEVGELSSHIDFIKSLK